MHYIICIRKILENKILGRKSPVNRASVRANEFPHCSVVRNGSSQSRLVDLICHFGERRYAEGIEKSPEERPLVQLKNFPIVPPQNNSCLNVAAASMQCFKGSEDRAFSSGGGRRSGRRPCVGCGGGRGGRRLTAEGAPKPSAVLRSGIAVDLETGAKSTCRGVKTKAHVLAHARLKRARSA